MISTLSLIPNCISGSLIRRKCIFTLVLGRGELSVFRGETSGWFLRIGCECEMLVIQQDVRIWI